MTDKFKTRRGEKGPADTTGAKSGELPATGAKEAAAAGTTPGESPATGAKEAAAAGTSAGKSPAADAKQPAAPTGTPGESRAAGDPGSGKPSAEAPAAPGKTRPLDSPAKPSPIRRLTIYGMILIVSFFIGVQLFNLVIMPAFVGHRDEVRVPDLTDKDVATAEAALAEAGLKLGDARQRYDPRPSGTIVDQHPDPLTLVKTGRTVAVIVSRGEAGGLVPSLEGQTLRNARLSLESAGLSLGEVVTVPSDQVSKDAIIATEPASGANAPKGTPVNVLVSQGGYGRAYVMPNLNGRDALEVQAALQQAGFTVQIEGRGGGFFTGRRRVTDHVPAPGARAFPGATITLYTD
jgi:beta-lactam-binding protein with PASTA domain